MEKCAMCGAPATHAVTDTAPETPACESCIHRAAAYGKACVELNKLVRQYSIPGSGVTREEIKQASLKAERLSPYSFA